MVGVPPSLSVAEAEQVSVVDVFTPELGLIDTVLTSGSEFSTVTEAVSDPVPPEASVAVAVHVMVSPTEEVAAVSVKLAPVPSESPSPLLQAYVMVGVPPSSSEAVAEQDRLEVVVTPVLGLTVTDAISGSVFSTVTEAESETEPPASSVAVAVHVMVSPADAVAADKVKLAPVPRAAPSPLLQA